MSQLSPVTCRGHTSLKRALTRRLLDDIEMYEKQRLFRLGDFVALSHFLNVFLYKAVLGNLFGKGGRGATGGRALIGRLQTSSRSRATRCSNRCTRC